jgi:4-diphosphocytidyl-2-C-methyl-D-erythritol kinase
MVTRFLKSRRNVLISSYAKINLYLRVLNQRPDGYHQIETLFSTIDLYDTLKFALTKKPLIKILSNIPELASENNLMHKVAKRIREKFGIREGIEIHLHKRIPVAAGLGGGSSNAAMTILALNRMCELNLKVEDINSLAAEFGSDVNFFLYGGNALGVSRGEKLELLPDSEPIELLLVNPGLGVSSREAYQLAKLDNAEKPDSDAWFNSLEYGIRKKYPVIDETINRLVKMGASRAMMSGSGATCFGTFADKALQDKVSEYFIGKNYWVKTVKTLTRSWYKECTQNLSL